MDKSRSPLDLPLLPLVQVEQFGRKHEPDPLATSAAQNVADMPLADADNISNLCLSHAAGQQITNKVLPFSIHNLVYRYRAMDVKRHSDISAIHTKNMETLAERLKHARGKSKLNQVQLAKKAGLKNQSIIGSLESGHRKSSTYIPAIAQVLGVNAIWLATGKGVMMATGEQPNISNFDRKLWDQVVWLWNNADPEIMTMFRMMINAAYIKRQADLQAQNVQDTGAGVKPNLELVGDADATKVDRDRS